MIENFVKIKQINNSKIDNSKIDDNLMFVNNNEKKQINNSKIVDNLNINNEFEICIYNCNKKNLILFLFLEIVEKFYLNKCF